MSDIKIPYVEIRNLNSRNILGIIEGAEIFFEYASKGAGAFEIYCRSNINSQKLLKKDNLVTLPNAVDEVEDNVWLIEKVQKTNDETGGRFIIATGREAKVLVNRRIVRYATVLTKGNNLVTEVRDKLFKPNLISPTVTSRRLDGFTFGSSSVVKTIEDTTQVTWENLFDYTEELFEKYGISSKLRLNKTTKQFIYTIYEGSGKQNIVFSPANENLLSSDYVADYTNYKTSVIVGGEESKDEAGNDTGIRTVIEIASVETGYARREVFIDAKDLQKEYEDENGEKQTMSTADYNAALKERGLEKQAIEHNAVITFNGNIDTTSSRYKYGRDYYLDDIVTIRDEFENISVPVKVLKFTRVQNDEGYNEYFESEEVGNVE